MQARLLNGLRVVAILLLQNDNSLLYFVVGLVARCWMIRMMLELLCRHYHSGYLPRELCALDRGVGEINHT